MEIKTVKQEKIISLVLSSFFSKESKTIADNIAKARDQRIENRVKTIEERPRKLIFPIKLEIGESIISKKAMVDKI